MHSSRICTACLLTVNLGRSVYRGAWESTYKGGGGLPAPWHCGKADTLMDRQTPVKNYLPAKSFAGGNKY